MKFLSAPRLLLTLGAVALLPLALSACDTLGDDSDGSQDQLHPLVEQAPPPMQPETIPLLDSPQTQLWRPGYWIKSNGQFVWVPGKVIPRPSPTAVWAVARWVHHMYGWSFQEGHWE